MSQRPVDRVVVTGWRVETHRHVLVPGLVGIGPPSEERGLLVVVLAAGAGVVVLDLVIVPRDHPRCEGVGLAQQGIRLVQGVTLAVLVERDGLEVLAGDPAARVGVPAALVLVDVVAEEHEGVDRALVGQVAVVVVVLMMLARKPRRVSRGSIPSNVVEGDPGSR